VLDKHIKPQFDGTFPEVRKLKFVLYITAGHISREIYHMCTQSIGHLSMIRGIIHPLLRRWGEKFEEIPSNSVKARRSLWSHKSYHEEERILMKGIQGG
jgi:hypothetical protein